MESLLNIFLIATLLVMAIAIWQTWQIIKRGKNSETPNERDVIKLERRLNVIHVGIYVLVVIVVFRIYLMVVAS